MFGLSTAKLIGLGIALIAVLGFIALALSWRSQLTQLQDWQTVVLAATKDAAGNPKLHPRDVASQVRELGASLKTTTAALERQNAAVAELGRRTAEQQASADEAERRARPRATGALATSQRLLDSSRRPSGACEPSEALREAWR